MPSAMVISGSPTDPSKTWALAEYVAARFNEVGIATSHLRLRDLPGDALVSGNVGHPDVARELARLSACDGAVFVTPIYKASFSGLMKLFIDLLPQFGLTGKVAMPLAVGGTNAHILALDYGLRPVLQSLGARHVVQSYFALQSEIGADGALNAAAAASPLFCNPMEEFRKSICRA